MRQYIFLMILITLTQCKMQNALIGQTNISSFNLPNDTVFSLNDKLSIKKINEIEESFKYFEFSGIKDFDIELYGKRENVSGLVKADPYDVKTNYLELHTLIKNKKGNLIQIQVSSANPLSDYSYGIIYYFDLDGNLAAIRKGYAMLDSQKTNGIQEESVYYFNDNRVIIKKTYSLKDAMNNKLKSTNYKIERKDFQVFWNIKEYLDYYKIKE